MLFLNTMVERLAIITLDEEDYFQGIEEASVGGVVGGTIYDAILARCAIKVAAEKIFTWNVRHYQMLGAEIVKRIRTP